MLWIVIVIVSPTRPRIVDQHRQPIRLLLQLFTKTQASGFVLQVRDDIGAATWAERVEAVSGRAQFGFFA